MNSNSELNGDKTLQAESQNGDESCVIIEEDITTIQIDDTLSSSQAQDIEESAQDDSVVTTSNITAGDGVEDSDEFQVIDQVGDSENEITGSQELLGVADKTMTVRLMT